MRTACAARPGSSSRASSRLARLPSRPRAPALPSPRDPADRAYRDALVKQHLGVYAYSPEALARWVSLPPHPLELTERLEQLRPIADGLALGVATVAAVLSGGIDTEEDLAQANARWTERKPSAA